jgi:uncharacterized membrane protein YcaP (DUF421 family)
MLFVIRILARRPGAQMTMFEFVLVFLIGGVIILATVGDDRSVTNCVCGVLTVGLMHRLVSRIRQGSDFRSAVIDGTPLILLKDGEWQKEVLRGSSIDQADVMAIARTKGMRTLDEIKYAVLERNGAISVIAKQDKG